MTTPILSTKLYIPPPRSGAVLRARLIKRLQAGLHRAGGRPCKLTLVSAPAGFGKTTLISEWIAGAGRAVAWLSLDEGDNDPVRFLTYLVAALQTLDLSVSGRTEGHGEAKSPATIGESVLRGLQSPQPPAIEVVLTALLNQIATVQEDFILVLDDYHAIGSPAVDEALTFLLDYRPPQLHLVIITREDPHLPLARLRARGQLTELRAADLRFTLPEATEFLNHVVGLDLAAESIAALEARTEGWIAGLQLAALSLRGHHDSDGFIESFAGSHHFVLDYLVEEVLHQQPERVQAFLLRTSILDRLCGPLCEAVCVAGPDDPHGLVNAGQETLEYLERANLFLVPLDNERRWYRYHHLFAGFLRQRLLQEAGPGVAEYHSRASRWHEDNGMALEAFQHAAAANDIDRAERLIAAKGMPLHVRGAVTAVLDWLASLPEEVLDARPSLWARHASLLLVTGQTTGVEDKLRAAEAALASSGEAAAADGATRDLIGHIAAARSTLALAQYRIEDIIVQAHRALEYLTPDNLPFRTTAIWTLANAYELRGDRVAAEQAYAEVIDLSRASGNTFFTILATLGLGNILEMQNRLHRAAEAYRRSLRLFEDQPLSVAAEAQLGMARLHYAWNELDAAQRHGERSLKLAQLYDNAVDRFVICEVFLARLKLAQGDVAGAAAMLAETEQVVRRYNFVHRMPEVAAAQVLALLRQGKLAAAARLAEQHELPLSRARVYLARGETGDALEVLAAQRHQVEDKGWQDERLKVLVLQAVAHYVHGEKEQAEHVLGAVLALAEPEGFVRVFVDEGPSMARLLSEAKARGVMPTYVDKLLAVFETEMQMYKGNITKATDARPPGVRPLIEPLTPREQEVLQLLATGCSNPEIAEQLVIAVTTVKTHVKNIYGKLLVTNRVQAAARAKDLDLV